MSEIAEKFSRITPIPAYQMVAEAIEREILSGRLRPGDPIGTEAELVRQFGVNRSTVREGIRLLEHGGLVQRDSSRRLSVGLPHYDRLATRATRALILHEVTFRELFEATMVLSIASIELAVERVTTEELERLNESLLKEVLERIPREALRTVPDDLRGASLALGATRWETIRKVVLPNSVTGILTGSILAVSRGAGEVAPILFTGAIYSQQDLPSSVSDQFMHLGYHLYILATQSPDVDATRPLQYATTIVLLGLTLALNLSAILLRSRIRRKQLM